MAVSDGNEITVPVGRSTSSTARDGLETFPALHATVAAGGRQPERFRRSSPGDPRRIAQASIDGLGHGIAFQFLCNDIHPDRLHVRE